MMKFHTWKSQLLIEQIPFEIIVYLFEFIPERNHWGVVSQTCRRWREAAIRAYDFTKDNNFALRKVMATRNIDGLRFLLGNGRVDPSVNDNMCIKFAARNGHLEMVRTLLENTRVDPSATNNYCI